VTKEKPTLPVMPAQKKTEGEIDFLQIGDFKHKTWTSRNLLSLAKAAAYCC